MSERTQIILALIVGLPLIIAAIANLIIAVNAAKKLNVVHTQIDGMKTELVAATKKEGQAEGEVLGREKAANEQAGRVAERERVEDRADLKKEN